MCENVVLSVTFNIKLRVTDKTLTYSTHRNQNRDHQRPQFPKARKSNKPKLQNSGRQQHSPVANPLIHSPRALVEHRSWHAAQRHSRTRTSPAATDKRCDLKPRNYESGKSLSHLPADGGSRHLIVPADRQQQVTQCGGGSGERRCCCCRSADWLRSSTQQQRQLDKLLVSRRSCRIPDKRLEAVGGGGEGQECALECQEDWRT